MIHFKEGNYLEIDEVCKLIGRKRLTLWRWMKKNGLPIAMTKVGKKYLFREEDIIDFKNTLDNTIA